MAITVEDYVNVAGQTPHAFAQWAAIVARYPFRRSTRRDSDAHGAFRAQGELWLNGQRCDTLPTEKRRVGVLFQDALLFDNMSVGQNLRLALPATVARKARRDRVEQALEHVELGGFYHRDPATLSGGQRARVALLRALLAEPDALLLDEPFSRLDKTLRANFRQWVFDELSQQQIPVVQVTHDPDDVPPHAACLQLSEFR